MRRVWRVELKSGWTRMVNDWPISFEMANQMARFRYKDLFVSIK